MITEAASIAINAIEGQLDTKIWRTRLRIQELILIENPYLKKNPFIFDQKLFLYILLNFSFIGTIATLKREEIDNSWEKFEEADIEPILYTDLLGLEWNAEYTSLIERIFQNWLVQWKDFEQIKDEMGIISPIYVPQLVQELHTKWLERSNIFYKYSHGTKDKEDESLPQLPAYI